MNPIENADGPLENFRVVEPDEEIVIEEVEKLPGFQEYLREQHEDEITFGDYWLDILISIYIIGDMKQKSVIQTIVDELTTTIHRNTSSNDLHEIYTEKCQKAMRDYLTYAIAVIVSSQAKQLSNN
jgi:hypothetical protein